MTFAAWLDEEDYPAAYSISTAPATAQTRDESGKDWWLSHCNLPDGGFVAVGYTSYVNWMPDDGCTPTNPTKLYKELDFPRMERPNRRNSEIRQSIARYNAGGDLLWFKSFANGTFFDVILDHGNNIVATGWNSDLKPSSDVQQHTIYFNPSSSSPSTNLASMQCNAVHRRQASVMKLDLNGTILWDHLYNFENDANTALARGSEGHGLIETFINGVYGYRIIGQNAIEATDPLWRDPYLFELDLAQNGFINWKNRYNHVPGLATTATELTVGWRIKRSPIGTGEYYAVTGMRIHDGGRSAAFLWVRMNDNTLFFKDTKESTDNVFAGHHSLQYDQNSVDACFLLQNGAPSAVVWPIMADFTTNGVARGYTFPSNHQAFGLVYKFDLAGNPAQGWANPVNLGTMRGFDLQMAITPTKDGNVAVASTKWSSDFSAAVPFGWSNLSTSVKNYLNEMPPIGDNVDLNGPYNTGGGGFFRWDEPTGPAWSERDPVTGAWGNVQYGTYDFGNSNGNFSSRYPYGYWNSYSYVAKLQGITGGVLWEKPWQEESGATATGWPGNFRQRQCNFHITETADRGLVVCGNTGHNFDDFYLAKLVECGPQVEANITHACIPNINTGSITTTVTGGSGNYTYLWSNGATTPSINNLPPGTYSVTVTETVGQLCSTTAIFTVGGPPNGHLLLLHSNCITGNLPASPWNTYVAYVTNGSGGQYSYVWYYQPSWPVGIPDIVGTNSVFVKSPGHLATYVAIIDNTTGCAAEVFLSESLPLATAASITPAACTSGGLGSINLNINPALGPYTYLWSNGATTQNNTGLTAGTYTLQLGYGNSCSETLSFTVPESAPCCSANINIPNGAHSSNYASPVNTTFNNTSLKITGIFHVDNNCFVNFSTIYMDPGAEIIVAPGAMFVVRDSHVEDCMGRMWKSITARNGAYVEMQRNTVKSGESAVTAMDGSSILLFNNNFTDNRVGLLVPDVPGTATNSVSAQVIGNRFTSSGTLVNAYEGQTTSLGHVGFAAIVANKISLDLSGTAGYSNTVDGMSNGIISYNSDLRMERFDFKNVQPDNAYFFMPADANGSGVFAIGRTGNHFLRQKGNGKTGAPSFSNCRWGIYAVSMNTDSRNNKMLNVSTGYRVDKARKTTDINRNAITAKLHGMVFNQNAGTLHFWVQDNDITFGTLTGPVLAPLCSGILVADGPSGGENSRIEGNTISMLAYPLAKAGITLYPARNWLVVGNSIQMSNGSFNRYGIANYGSSRLEVSCNNVLGGGTAYTQGMAAIYSNMGDRLLFGCNELDLTTNGLLFNGAAYEVEVRGNSMRQHKYGLHLSSNAIIGAQLLKGNLWHNPPAAGGLGAWYEPIVQGVDNPHGAQFPFTYNPALINGGNTAPPSWDPNDWFALDLSGTNYSCTSGQNQSYCGQFHVARMGTDLTGLDGLIAKDSLQNDPYTAQSKWMLKDGLYAKLDDDPALRYGDQEMADFWAEMQGTATAAFKLIDDGRPALYAMDSTVVTQLQANNDEITALMDSVKLRMGQLQDSTLTDAQRAAVLAGIAGFREGIRTLAAWNATAMETARTSKVLTADGLKDANSNIGTTELIETNRKTLDQIYLSTIAKDVDSFTVDQAADLYAIANQCPMVGGNSVYTARALYRLIDEAVEYDDQILCLPHGILVKSIKQQDPKAMALLPNPARDEVTLLLEQPLDGPGQFVVYNALGAEVLRLPLEAQAEQYTLGTANLAPAIYHYQVRGPAGVVGTGKLTIVR